MYRLAVVLCSFFCAASAFGQSQPASDPQALRLAAQSIAAMVGSATITDVTLTGNATWIAGSDSQTGSVTLRAFGTSASRIDLNLSGGPRSEVRNAIIGMPMGQWTDARGVAYNFAPHNLRTDAVWFFPPLTSLAVGSSMVLSYVGQESRNGQSVQHLHSYINDGTTATRQLSATEFYLDSNSLLPVATTFRVHPDNDQSTNIPVEIDFSGYQPMGGIVVPTHVQKLLDRQLILDVTISSATVNSGLSPSLFATN